MHASICCCILILYHESARQVNNNLGGAYNEQSGHSTYSGRGAGVKLWQIADALGIADCSLSRKLRKELLQEEKDRIFGIIRELSQEVG